MPSFLDRSFLSTGNNCSFAFGTTTNDDCDTEQQSEFFDISEAPSSSGRSVSPSDRNGGETWFRERASSRGTVEPRGG